MERGLSWLMAPYTAAEQAVIQGKLWQLLERQKMCIRDSPGSA